jgi:hypothetical protein
MGIVSSFPGVKRPGREPGHSPTSSAEVENGGAIPPLPNTSSYNFALPLSINFLSLYYLGKHIISNITNINLESSRHLTSHVTSTCSLWNSHRDQHFQRPALFPANRLPLLKVGGTMLQAGRSRVRFPMKSLHFSIDLILPAAL